MDRPVSPNYNVDNIIEGLRSFNGHVIIQTMFMKGRMGADNVDNTSERFVTPWLEALRKIKPMEVMIYTIDRETPDQDLLKATREELNTIRDRVAAEGFACTASY